MNRCDVPAILAGYPAGLVEPVLHLLAEGRLGDALQRRYPLRHAVRSDRALYDYVHAIKNECLRNTPPLSKVVYDNSLQLLRQALGTHTRVSRVQGGRLKAKNEIRIATVFREAPEAFLRMIVVHELAHLREREHGKEFYQLCRYMEPAYHQLEFDLRVWLLWRDAAAM
jgi:predicted metal-dependent hydrolase